MNTNRTDNQLHQLFDEVKKHDADIAPEFARLARAPIPAPTAWQPWLLLSTAAATLMVVGISLSLFYSRSQQPAVDTQQWASLSDWQASTDELLHVATEGTL